MKHQALAQLPHLQSTPARLQPTPAQQQSLLPVPQMATMGWSALLPTALCQWQPCSSVGGEGGHVPTTAPTAANAKMQSGTTHAAHRVTIAKGHSSGAGHVSVQSPTLPRLLEVWWLTTTNVAAWATVLRACVQTLNGTGTAATQALPACAGMPTIGSAGTFHLHRLHDDGCNAGGVAPLAILESAVQAL